MRNRERGKKTSESSKKKEPWANFREASSLINSAKTARVDFMSILTEAHSFPWNLHLSDASPGTVTKADLRLGVISVMYIHINGN